MNKFFRLIHVLLFSRFRSTVNIMDECATPFTVLPNDLDVLMHMNNGVYLSLQDLARVDYMIRANVASIISKNNWYPVVASEMIRFRRSLKPFTRFQLHTRMVSWDEKNIFLEHKFMQKGQLMAIGMIRARFLSKGGELVSPQELLQAIGLEASAPEFPSYLKDWLAADSSHIQSVES